MEITKSVIEKFDEAVSRGFSFGVGKRDGQMCVEAAICYALGLPHSDNPGCVTYSVMSFKIVLNDQNWSSPQARAKGLRNLGIAQLGSKGIVVDEEFFTNISKKLIQVLIPTLFREIFPNNAALLAAADRCEREGTNESAYAAAKAAAAVADVTNAATWAAWAANATAAGYASNVAAAAGFAAAAAGFAERAARLTANAINVANNTPHIYNSDKYLTLVAELALDVLKDLNSPGVEWL